MTAVHAILILIIRLWAAYIIMSVLSAFLFYSYEALTANPDDPDASHFLDAAIYQFVWLAAGLAAWFAAEPIVRRLYTEEAPATKDIKLDPVLLISIGGFLIGCFFLVQYLPSLVLRLGELLADIASREQHDPPVQFRFHLQTLIGPLGTVLVAAWMAFRPADLARMFMRLRRAGLSRRDFEADTMQPDASEKES